MRTKLLFVFATFLLLATPQSLAQQDTSPNVEPPSIAESHEVEPPEQLRIETVVQIDEAVTDVLDSLNTSIKAIETNLETSQKINDRNNWPQFALIGVSIASAVAALFAARSASRMPRIQNRAYCLVHKVAIKSNSIHDENAGPVITADGLLYGMSAELCVKNVGQTPSLKTQIRCEFYLSPSDCSESENVRQLTTNFILPPDCTHLETVPWSGNFIPLNEFIENFSDDKKIWLKGEILFEDIFGKSWKTKFCYVVDKPYPRHIADSEFHAHSSGNEFKSASGLFRSRDSFAS